MLPNANLIILPDTYRTLTAQSWANLLLGSGFEDPAMIPQAKPKKNNNKKRAKELLSNSATLGTAQQTKGIEDCFKKLKDPATFILTMGHLQEILEYFDSSLSEWHVSRGLKPELAARKDLIAITHKNPFPGFANEYFQEYCVLGYIENGYHFFFVLKNAFYWIVQKTKME